MLHHYRRWRVTIRQFCTNHLTFFSSFNIFNNHLHFERCQFRERFPRVLNFISYFFSITMRTSSVSSGILILLFTNCNSSCKVFNSLKLSFIFKNILNHITGLLQFVSNALNICFCYFTD